MKHFNKPFYLLFAIFSCCSLLCGCAEKEVTCPFTEANWENTSEEILALEPELTEGGESSYYGDSYIGPKTYQDLAGTIQYMFDEDGKLALIQWSYKAATADDAQTLYQTLHRDLEDKYGEGDFNSKFSSSIGGDVWYLENGNIILMYAEVSDYQAVQLSFVSPDHSLDNPNK